MANLSAQNLLKKHLSKKTGKNRFAFHPKAMMYSCSGGDVTIMEIEGLYAYVSSQ
jgi:hypothetical protein